MQGIIECRYRQLLLLTVCVAINTDLVYVCVCSLHCPITLSDIVESAVDDD